MEPPTFFEALCTLTRSLRTLAFCYFSWCLHVNFGGCALITLCIVTSHERENRIFFPDCRHGNLFDEYMPSTLSLITADLLAQISV